MPIIIKIGRRKKNEEINFPVFLSHVLSGAFFLMSLIVERLEKPDLRFDARVNAAHLFLLHVFSLLYVFFFIPFFLSFRYIFSSLFLSCGIFDQFRLVIRFKFVFLFSKSIDFDHFDMNVSPNWIVRDKND